MDLEALRHSASHIMAQAVKELYAEVKLGIGPAIADGFYYDFERKEPFVPEDLAKIEKKMAEIISRDLKFEKEEITKDEALKIFKKRKEDYKLELIKELPGKKVSVYRQGDFMDLCKGPHLASTGEVRVFKLTSIAGAYWRGNENNPMLQRIYGTAFAEKEELKKYLDGREEALKRDHRKLGKELDYFRFHDQIGPGLVLYHHNGAVLRMLIEDFGRRAHLRHGYKLVAGPHILKSDIWVRSGHYEYYKENMYIFRIGGEEYAIKPMNCPGHMLVYKAHTRSYKDLPIRYFEWGTVYRNEKSGVLHGLLRVRGFTQDDAHIFCLKEQLQSEIIAVIDFVIEVMDTFGFKDYEVELSTRPAKFIGSDKDWKEATSALIKAMQAKGINYEVNEGEGAFYGPKIDIKLKDALGRAWQCATIQCDFALPERFDLTYIGEDGKKHRPIMLHRVILGSMERFMGALLEHYAGALPLWLSPVEAVIMPITAQQNEYAAAVKESLEQEDIRVEMDLRSEKINYKIREAELQKIPYMLIVGEKEVSEGKVAVRARKQGNQGMIPLDAFIKKINEEVKSHC